MTYELIKSHRLHVVSKGLIDDLSTSAERGLACTAASPLAPALASQLRYGDEAVFSRRAESDDVSRVLFRRRDNRCDLRCILATPLFHCTWLFVYQQSTSLGLYYFHSSCSHSLTLPCPISPILTYRQGLIQCGPLLPSLPLPPHLGGVCGERPCCPGPEAGLEGAAGHSEEGPRLQVREGGKEGGRNVCVLTSVGMYVLMFMFRLRFYFFLQALVAATPYFSEPLRLRVIIFLSDADRESIFS